MKDAYFECRKKFHLYLKKKDRKFCYYLKDEHKRLIKGKLK
jgi:hypothetical protein